VPPAHGVLRVGGGFSALFPTVSLEAGGGVTRRLDLTAHYDTHAGLAHVYGLTARVGLPRSLAVSIDVSHSNFALEEISGIQAVRAPIGNGLTSTFSFHGSRVTAGGVHFYGGGGLTLRWLVPRERPEGTVERVFDLTVNHLYAELGAEWERKSGALYLRFRAIVPIQTELNVLGYLPWVVIGRTWNVP